MLPIIQLLAKHEVIAGSSSFCVISEPTRKLCVKMCDQFVEMQKLDILKQISSNRYTLYDNLYQVQRVCEFLCIKPERVQKFILANWSTLDIRAPIGTDSLCSYSESALIAKTTLEGIVQCIMQISHSNDCFAKSVTLLYLAALAPLISENIKVHFLLIESLDSTEDTELVAAVYAIKSVGKYSRTFPSLIFEKIYGLLRSKSADIELKVRLMNVVAEFKPSFMVTRNSLKLCRLLMKKVPTRIICQCIYNTMTEVAIKSCWAVPRLICFCLVDLKKCLTNKSLTICLLNNLNRLVVFSHHWKHSQIKELQKLYFCFDRMKSVRVSIAWLKFFLKYFSGKIHCSVVNDNDIPWLKLFQSRSMKVRLFTILLSTVVLKQKEEKSLRRLSFMRRKAISKTLYIFRTAPKFKYLVIGCCMR